MTILKSPMDLQQNHTDVCDRFSDLKDPQTENKKETKSMFPKGVRQRLIGKLNIIEIIVNNRGG
jgi:hypothetical protein